MDVITTLKTDLGMGPGLDQMLQGLGVEESVTDEVFEKHIISVGKNVLKAVGRLKTPMKNKNNLKFKVRWGRDRDVIGM